MRRIAYLGFALPALLLAADLFAQLGWEQAAFEDTCFHFVAEPERLPSMRITPAMRALALAQRKGAVEAIGAKAKAYYASDTFKLRWAQHRQGFTGGDIDPEQRAAQEAEGTKMMTQQMQQMEAMMPMMPPEAQAQMKQAMAKAKADQAKKADKAKARAAKPEPDNAPPKDPKVNIKKALQHFLAVTDGVDYGAAISLQNGRRYFANGAYEAKPDTWKMTFRAGKEASEGARSYARVWLAELK
ncbi:MAG: hypothetical protein IPN59_03280 [Holophaga sp.]|nr:hypothetical protein [Holophaga sp.]